MKFAPAESTTPRPLRLLIVHDDHIYRHSLAAALAGARFQPIDLADNAEHALHRAQNQPPDVVLIDWSLPEKTGLDLTGDLHRILPDVKVLILGMIEDEGAILGSIQAGIAGYVLKRESLDDLLVRIDQAVQGEASCSPHIAQLAFGRWAALTREQRDDERHASAQLTQRELEILCLMDKGLRYKDIAKLLSVSCFTVKNHVHHLFEKLCVHDRTRALQCAHDRGWVKG